MTASTSTPAASPAKAFACSRSDGDVGADARHEPRLLLQSAADSVCAALPVDVVGREATLNGALARLVRIAVTGVFRHRAVTPVPLDGRTIEVRVVVAAVAEIHSRADAQRREADGRRHSDGQRGLP